MWTWEGHVNTRCNYVWWSTVSLQRGSKKCIIMPGAKRTSKQVASGDLFKACRFYCNQTEKAGIHAGINVCSLFSGLVWYWSSLDCLTMRWLGSQTMGTAWRCQGVSGCFLLFVIWRTGWTPFLPSDNWNRLWAPSSDPPDVINNKRETGWWHFQWDQLFQANANVFFLNLCFIQKP